MISSINSVGYLNNQRIVKTITDKIFDLVAVSSGAWKSNTGSQFLLTTAELTTFQTYWKITSGRIIINNGIGTFTTASPPSPATQFIGLKVDTTTPSQISQTIGLNAGAHTLTYSIICRGSTLGGNGILTITFAGISLENFQPVNKGVWITQTVNFTLTNYTKGCLVITNTSSVDDTLNLTNITVI
jgi:hypothetical protein